MTKLLIKIFLRNIRDVRDDLIRNNFCGFNKIKKFRGANLNEALSKVSTSTRI
jgi:hypothetical protein